MSSNTSSLLSKINFLYKNKLGNTASATSSSASAKPAPISTIPLASSSTIKNESTGVSTTTDVQIPLTISTRKLGDESEIVNEEQTTDYRIDEEKVIPFEGILVEPSDPGLLTSVHHESIEKKAMKIAMMSNTQKKQDTLKTKRQITQEREEERQKLKTMRKSAGEVWVDPNMALYQDNDYRLFCGNLGNEVTDDVLQNSFKKYNSFSRARVVRDKRSQKTKGYGFVSFLDPQDYLRALKEMQAKYIGNRPVKLIKSEWQERSFDEKKDDELGNKFLKKGIQKQPKIPQKQFP